MSAAEPGLDKNQMRCPICGYDLRANPSSRCAECGARIGVIAHDSPWAGSRIWLWMLIFAWTAASAGASAYWVWRDAAKLAKEREFFRQFNEISERTTSMILAGQTPRNPPPPVVIQPEPLLKKDVLFISLLCAIAIAGLVGLSLVLRNRRSTAARLRCAVWFLSLGSFIAYVATMLGVVMNYS